MQERPLDRLQAELDAQNAARLQRIQNGANTRRIPFAERSFSFRDAGLPKPDVPNQVPQVLPPLSVEAMAKRLEDMERGLIVTAARIDSLEGDSDRNGALEIKDPPWEHFLSFGWYRVDDTHIKVTDGRVYPYTDYATAYSVGSETTIELTGSTPSVYVAFEYATNAVTVDTGSAYAGSSPFHFRVLLYRFTLLSSGSYALTDTHHAGDVYLHWPYYPAAATEGALMYWDDGWKNWQVLEPPADDCLLRNNAGTLSWVDRSDYLNP